MATKEPESNLTTQGGSAEGAPLRGASFASSAPRASATNEILEGDILEEQPIESQRGDPISAAPVTFNVDPTSTQFRRSRSKAVPARPRRRSLVPWLLGGLALGTLGSLAALVALRLYETRVPRAVSSVTVVRAASSAERPPDPVADAGVPTVPLDTLPVVHSTRGTLRFVSAARSHRLYLDGALVGQADAPLEVNCGRHAVKVGSHGDVQMIDVPCGGDVLVKMP